MIARPLGRNIAQKLHIIDGEIELRRSSFQLQQGFDMGPREDRQHLLRTDLLWLNGDHQSLPIEEQTRSGHSSVQRQRSLQGKQICL